MGPHIFHYDSLRFEGTYNFGDYITPFIYDAVRHRGGLNARKGAARQDDVVTGAGSILGCAPRKAIIWGTGLQLGTETPVSPEWRIRSVRGPLTRRRLLALGIQCPARYGDIGLILPHFYKPKTTKKYKLGFIPHYIDRARFNGIHKPEDGVTVIDVTRPIGKVIESILECEMTMSSSLHGIIVSHAYGIRSMWMRVTDKVAGKGFKFRDYYGSVGVPQYEHMRPYLYDKHVPVGRACELIHSYPNPRFPIDTQHVLGLCPF